MQTRHLLAKRNKVWGIDEAEYGKEAYLREKKIKLYDQLRRERCGEKTALEAINVSRSTLFRWRRKYHRMSLSGLENQSKAPKNVRTKTWDRKLENYVLAIRRSNILYGKHKVRAVLERDHRIKASASTIGRIISNLIKREKIKPASFYYANKILRPRNFNQHARRWKIGMKGKKPGELVQIDHMTVRLTADYRVKHFQATCPVTKIVVKQAYVRATSNIAALFLNYVQEQLPFPLRSVQTDGGSEFMGIFEQTCKTRDIPLYVLPPRSPKYNGIVERANGSVKYEFYASYFGPLNLVAIRSKLSKYTHKYNHFRPHQALQYKTPMQYYQSQEGQKSHML